MIAPMIGMMMSPTSEVTMRAERRADDDADREVDDVALHGEFLEFLEHAAAPSCFSCREAAKDPAGGTHRALS